MGRNLTVDEVCENLKSEGFLLRVWRGGGVLRVYIKRSLRRGHVEVGYVESRDGGAWSCHTTAQGGRIRACTRSSSAD